MKVQSSWRETTTSHDVRSILCCREGHTDCDINGSSPGISAAWMDSAESQSYASAGAAPRIGAACKETTVRSAIQERSVANTMDRIRIPERDLVV